MIPVNPAILKRQYTFHKIIPNKSVFMPIRILFLTTGLFIGGEETQNLQTFTMMKKRGFEIIIGTTKDAGPFSQSFIDAGIDIIPNLLSGRFDIPGLFRIKKLIREKNIDIICTGGFGDSLFYGRVAGKLTNVKAIVNTFFHFGRLDRKNTKIEIFNNLIHPLATVFKTSSLALRDFLINEMGYPAEKIVAIHDGINTSKFSINKPTNSKYEELNIPKGKPVVGIVASLYPFKGPDLFVEAAALVHKEYPDTVFIMVGEGDERPKVESLIKDSNLEDTVLMLGYRSDVPEILPIFDIFVLASDTEAFPNTLLEASACGKPLVSTNVGGAPEIVVEGYNGFLVPPRSPIQMADRIIRLLSDKDLMQSMSSNARKRVLENFSIEHKVEVFSRFFRELYEGKCIPSGLYN
ncbi:MAG: glycosyltransferase [candidate division Zixibacteria bacterium]|nr:glycosyltransferase [candidate division Zixibacteria bacterium]